MWRWSLYFKLQWAGRLLECLIALCITHLRATVPLLCADHRVYCTIYIRVHQAFHFCAYFQRSSEKHTNAKLERTLALLPLLHAISPRPPSPFFESKYPHSVNLRIVMMIDSLKGLVPRRTMSYMGLLPPSARVVGLVNYVGIGVFISVRVVHGFLRNMS